MTLHPEPEAARALHVSTRTLQRLREQGRIGFVRVGRKVFYTDSDLERFVEAQRVEPVVYSLRRRAR